MITRLLTASAAILTLCACSTIERLNAAPQTPPIAEQRSFDPITHEGLGSDWRTLADQELLARLNRPQREGKAKNVILFVADGMGLSTITAARIYQGQLRGEPGEENYLPFEEWGHSALVKTYNENAQVPDSAGTATAMHTGVKSHIGAISVYARQTFPEACGEDADLPVTTLERAEEYGMATGVVSTARITHATPASAYAHVPDRGWEADGSVPQEAKEAGCRDIAQQLIDTRSASDSGSGSGNGPEVVLGGGRAAFTPADHDGYRQDGQDLTQVWADMDGVYVETADDFRAIADDDTRPVLGLFTRSHMAYEHDRDDAEEPSLAEMTQFAIERLSQDEDGYYLLVEAGRVDHAHHMTNAFRALNDALAFSDAVEAAANMTDPEDTLIIVTADHSHVFTIAGYPRRGNPILGLVHPAAPDLSDAPTPPLPAQDGRPYTTLGYHNGPNRREIDTEALTQEQVLDPDYRQETAIPMGSETHAGEDVIAFARGPWAHLVDGTMEQHTLNRIITFAYGWDENSETGEDPH